MHDTHLYRESPLNPIARAKGAHEVPLSPLWERGWG